MTIGLFTTVTDPVKRGDNFDDAMACYSEIADKVVVIDGEGTWPEEFSWEVIGQHFQKGYEALDTDWVIHMDIDFIFHQADKHKIRRAFERHYSNAAMSFYKKQFILPDRFNVKSRLVLAVNKGMYGDRIKFNGGGDLCQPTIDGFDITTDMVNSADIGFYNYEHLIKTQAQSMADVGRMNRAYHRRFNKPLYSLYKQDRPAYAGWIAMMKGRFNKPSEHIPIEAHPIYVQETIKKLRPDQFGFAGHGELECNDYVRDGMMVC